MTQNEIVSTDILLEFLEVSFHNILYFRKLYPEEVFYKKKIYGTAVHVCQHPELKEYINKILISIQEILKENGKSLQGVHLTFVNSNKIPIEKYVFDLENFQADKFENDPYFMKTEEALRTICLKLSMSETYLTPLPADSTFIIDVITLQSVHVALSENSKCQDFPWIVIEELRDVKNSSLLPLNTVKTDYLTIQLYVIEDTKNKLPIK